MMYITIVAAIIEKIVIGAIQSLRQRDIISGPVTPSGSHVQ
jgi:hypothetical protein